MSKKLNIQIKSIDHLQGHNKRQGFAHYTDRDIRSYVLFAPNQWYSKVKFGYLGLSMGKQWIFQKLLQPVTRKLVDADN